MTKQEVFKKLDKLYEEDYDDMTAWLIEVYFKQNPWILKVKD